MKRTQKHIPNLLTYSRIAVIPLFVAAFYMGPAWQWAPLGLFLYASITDFFDGYLARKWNIISDIGRVLDPIADKLLVAAALVTLTEIGYLKGWIAVSFTTIILCRELFVSGLREALENKGITIHVTQLAKWKTTTQMLSIALFLWCYSQMGGIHSWEMVNHASGASALFIALNLYGLAALLTLITGVEYTVKGFRALKKAE